MGYPGLGFDVDALAFLEKGSLSGRTMFYHLEPVR